MYLTLSKENLSTLNVELYADSIKAVEIHDKLVPVIAYMLGCPGMTSSTYDGEEVYKRFRRNFTKFVRYRFIDNNDAKPEEFSRFLELIREYPNSQQVYELLGNANFMQTVLLRSPERNEYLNMEGDA